MTGRDRRAGGVTGVVRSLEGGKSETGTIRGGPSEEGSIGVSTDVDVNRTVPTLPSSVPTVTPKTRPFEDLTLIVNDSNPSDILFIKPPSHTSPCFCTPKREERKSRGKVRWESLGTGLLE